MLENITAENKDALIASGAAKVAYAGAGTSSFAWLVSQDGLAVVGVCVAILGLAVNWYYKHKDDKRSQAEHELRMADLREELARDGR